MAYQLSSSSPADVESAFEWNEVVRLTVEACRHRRDGRERIATRILQESLPAAIRAWGVACRLAADVRKDRLRAMITWVGDRVALEALQRRIRLGEAAAAGAAAVRTFATDPIGLKGRIPIDDISGMLDALADAEAESAALRPSDVVPDSPFALSL